MDEKPFPYEFSAHALAKAKGMGVQIYKMMDAVLYGKQTAVFGHPTQTRYAKNGIAVVADGESKSVVTLYLDQVKTPLREDQKRNGERIERW